MATEIRTIVGDEAVRAALSGTLLFSGLLPDKTPVLALPGVITMLLVRR